MEFYDVLERRRTVRDFSHKEVSDALLKKVLAAAFCAPTNDHLHQLEFIVIRDKNRIAEMIAPVAGNTEAIQQTYIAAEGHAMDELAMFEDALPKQQRMLMQSGCLVLPFFRQRGCPLCEPGEQSGLNYFASAWAAMENIFLAAAAEGLGCALRISIAGESAHAKSSSARRKTTSWRASSPSAGPMRPSARRSGGKKFPRKTASTRTDGKKKHLPFREGVFACFIPAG